MRVRQWIEVLLDYNFNKDIEFYVDGELVEFECVTDNTIQRNVSFNLRRR